MLKWISTISLLVLLVVFYVPFAPTMKASEPIENPTTTAEPPKTTSVDDYVPKAAMPINPSDVIITHTESIVSDNVSTLSIITTVSKSIKEIVSTGTALITIWSWLSHFKKKKNRRKLATAK